MSDARKLDIKSCRAIHTGAKRDGQGTFTIYEVEATNADNGIIVNQPLRSFDNLPLGVGTYEIAPYKRQGHPTTYTLSLPKGERAAHRARNAESLEQRVEFLEEQIQVMKNSLAQLTAGAPTPAAGLGPQPTTNPGGFASDDDVPF